MAWIRARIRDESGVALDVPFIFAAILPFCLLGMMLAATVPLFQTVYQVIPFTPKVFCGAFFKKATPWRVPGRQGGEPKTQKKTPPLKKKGVFIIGLL